MGAFGDGVDAVRTGRRDDIQQGYYTVQPNRWTFQSDKIRAWVESRLRGRTLNACAGKTKLAHDHEIVRNDIDPEQDADIHVDVCELGAHFDAESFDTIVYDPPYSQQQAKRSYEGKTVGDDALAKRQFHDLLRPGGRVIQFGYSTTCMPMALEYDRLEAVIWNTLGRTNDYLSVIDEKPGENPSAPRWFSAGEGSEE